MFANFFREQLDYIYFFYGLSFILMAVICRLLVQRKSSVLPWFWLGLFGIAHGVNEWLDLCAISIGDNSFFKIVRLCVMAISFVFLFEFGRQSTNSICKRKIGSWVFLPLIALVVCGWSGGVNGLNISFRYTFGLIGGLWSAWEMFRCSKREDVKSLSLFTVAVSMMFYAFATGAIVPKGNFFLASIVNQDSFFAIVGVPVQLFRALFAVIMAMVLWQWSQKFYWLKIQKVDKTVGVRHGNKLMILLIVILIGGWFMSEVVGEYQANLMRRHLLERTIGIASVLNVEKIKALKGGPVDKASPHYRRLKDQIKTVANSQNDIRYVYLMGLRNGKIFFFVDAQADRYASLNVPDSEPGEIYEESSHGLIKSFSDGEPFVEGPSPDKWGAWVSALAPIKDKATGHILAVTGMDIDAKDYQREIATYRLVSIGITLIIILILVDVFVGLQKSKEFAEELQNHLNKIQAIFESSHDAILLFQGKGFIDCNSQTLKMFGFDKKEDFLGIHPADISPKTQPNGENSHALAEEVIRTIYEKGYHRFEWMHCRKNGEVFPTEVLVSRFQLGGEIVLQSTIRDITERRQAEEKLKKTFKELEDSKASVENLNRQLKDALEQAQIHAMEAALANQAKSTFLSAMSHEIRTPMNGVLGMAELLAETSLNDEQKEYLFLIQTSGENLLGIINDILDYSKLEAGRMELEDVSFDIQNTILSSVKLMSMRAKEKGISLEAKLDDRLPAVVKGDPLRFKQIFFNFISNAIKFTEKGGVVVEARIEHIDDARAVIYFAVSDTGMGIRADAKEYLFQEFVQADNSVSRRFGGTGLGLAICKKIVTLMNGEIGVESEFEKGSTFWFRASFPVVAHTSAPVQEEEAKTFFGKLRVLLAEDNLVNQKVAAAILKKIGHEMVVANNGWEAIEILQKENFDVILMDVQMPEMDGLVAAMEIRKLPSEKSRIPIIALTANATMDDRQICMDVGMNGYLSKPIKTKELLEELSHVFG